MSNRPENAHGRWHTYDTELISFWLQLDRMIIYARIISNNLVMQYLRFLHFSHETHQNLYAHIWGCPERLKKIKKILRPFWIFNINFNLK